MKNKTMISLFMATILSSCNLSNPTLISHMVEGEFIGDKYVFPMNTITNLNMYYQDQLDEVVEEFDNIVSTVSKKLDRYHDYNGINNLKTVNDSCGTNEFVQLDDDLFEMIDLGIKLTKLTEGKFNLAMGSIIDLYSPILSEETTGTFNSLPLDSEISKSINSIPSYENIEETIVLNYQDKSIKLNKYNNENVIISLGAIAKGFVIDKAYEYLNEFKYPCLIDAGSSTMMMLGENPLRKGGNFNISFRNPTILNKDESVSLLTTISLKGDAFISSSGSYQQNFYYYDKQGKKTLMHHIIDPFKGVSNNFVNSVSLVSNDASLAVLDALSTAIFNVEKIEEASSLINLIEQTFKCSISYMITKPVSNSFDKFDVYLSNSFKELIIEDFSKEVINIYTV